MNELLETLDIPRKLAVDIGVGQSTFELTKYFDCVLALDTFQSTDYNKFLAQCVNKPIVPVRMPGQFMQGHCPNDHYDLVNVDMCETKDDVSNLRLILSAWYPRAKVLITPSTELYNITLGTFNVTGYVLEERYGHLIFSRSGLFK